MARQRKTLLILNADKRMDGTQHSNLANFTHGLIYHKKNNSDNLAIVTYDAHLGHFPDPDDEFAGVIITGSVADIVPGKDGKIEPWLLELAAYVRKAAEKEIPVLGVCFGHQLVAFALGGKVEPIGVKDEVDFTYELGFPEINLTQEGLSCPLFNGLSKTFRSDESHRYRVTKIPENSVLIAENRFGVQGFRYGKSVFGIQFHPEIFIDQAKISITRKLDDPSNKSDKQQFKDALARIEEEYALTNGNYAKIIYDNFVNHYVLKE